MLDMNIKVHSSKPSIYADMNIFRYAARGELDIKNARDFQFLYSSVHLDEMVRTGNKEALKGMDLLEANEIKDVLDQNFKSVGNIQILQHESSSDRFAQHQDTIAGSEGVGDHLIEFLLRTYGADNYAELELTPNQLVAEIDKLTVDLPKSEHAFAMAEAKSVAKELAQSIKDNLSQPRTLTETRNTLGLTDKVRAEAVASDSPIQAVWDLTRGMAGDLTLDQSFGFEQIEVIESTPRTQYSAAVAAYAVLNLLGLNADSGLSKRNKIQNSLSDSQHVGLASYCDALLSADKRLCRKASAIYKHMNNRTNVLKFDYIQDGHQSHTT